MRYLKYTHVDAETGVPVTQAPAAAGPAMPVIEGLTFAFALVSQYPTSAPTFFGTCPADSDVTANGVLDVLTEEQFIAAQETEMAARQKLVIARKTDVVQNYLDAKAAERGYDGIQSAALRAAFPNSPYHDEGVAYGEWMDNCWARCYQIMGDVMTGVREIPSDEELVGELPELVLPERAA